MIKLLDKSTCELIAAGEVVERPASVVKELCENSLDAGAAKVEIELRSGGLRLIRVSDDGCGIASDEVRRAFLRHATSKISNAADLDSIQTLGFRGEALAAISSVSRMETVTRRHEDELGVRYALEAGEEVSFEETGAPAGTTMWVRDLFFNTPARMKFLKKDVHEGNAVQNIIEQLALSRPDVAFRLIREGKTVFSTPGDGKLFSAAYCVMPRETAEALVELRPTPNGRIKIGGYVSRPSAARATRSAQYIFVNGRCVRSRSICASAEEACRGLVMVGKKPAFIINIELPCGDVDVNVHPAKTEVRFRSEREVTSAVYSAVRLTLDSAEREFAPFGAVSASKPANESQQNTENTAAPAPETDFEPKAQPARILDFSQKPAKPAETVLGCQSAPDTARPFATRQGAKYNISSLDIECDDTAAGLMSLFSKASEGERAFVRQNVAEYKTSTPQTLPDEPQTASTQPTEQAAPSAEEPCDAEPEYEPTTLEGFEKNSVELRIVGEVMHLYIVAEAGDMLVLIDKHAAHERLLFEKLRDCKDGIDRQLLAEPIIVPVSVAEKNRLLENAERLEHIGFVIDEFGEREVAVREIPTYLAISAVKTATEELAERLSGAAEPDTTAREWLLHSVACRAAIKSGHHSSTAELTALVGEMLNEKIPLRCPHGRPVYITFDKRELEKRFGRIQ